MKVAARHCIEGEVAYFKAADEAEGPGHIYSQAGLREFDISNMCEFHFDECTEERGPTGQEDHG
jgi:hypothetical protein